MKETFGVNVHVVLLPIELEAKIIRGAYYAYYIVFRKMHVCAVNCIEHFTMKNSLRRQ